MTRACVSLFRTRLLAGFQYRAAAWAGVATQFFWGFMFIMIYEAFYGSSDAVMPMDFRTMCTYLWLQQAFLHLFALWTRDGELFEMITSGNVAYELCRPLSLYPFWYARLLATRCASVSLRFAPILLVASFLPLPYRLLPPPSPAQFLFFLAALLTAMGLSVALSMFIYILTFLTLNPTGSIIMLFVVADFLSGSIIAVPFMPRALQHVVYALPFRYTADFPFRVYSGNIPLTEGLWQLGVAWLWLAALVGFGAWAMRRVLRRTVVQGG